MNLSSEKQPLDQAHLILNNLPAVEKMDNKGSGGAANVHKMRIYLLFNIVFLLLFILIIFPLAFTNCCCYYLSRASSSQQPESYAWRTVGLHILAYMA